MNRIIYINDSKLDAAGVMQQMQYESSSWKLSGLEFIIQMLDPSDAPVNFHTSGTTGVPKEISFRKSQIWKSAENTCSFFGINSDSQLLLCLPTEFVAGRLMIARAIIVGAHLIWEQPSLNPLKLLNSGIDFAAFTPAQISAILDDITSSNKLEKVKKIIIGGGEISCELEKKLMKLKPEMFATYGMTETLTHVAVRKIGDEVYHSLYPDAIFSVNKEQCLEITLPLISPDPILTNDMVELLSTSSFKWKGRKDHVINSGGVKLHPEEMEKKLILSGVLGADDFYITSTSDQQFGQIPVIVMLKDRMPGDMATFLNQINRLLNKYEAVKSVTIFDKFEYTNNGKLKRQRF